MKNLWQGFACSLLLLATVTMTWPAEARAEAPLTSDASVSLYNHYIWRGFEYSKDSIVLQPSVTFYHERWSLNLWSNIDLDETWRSGTRWNETDFTLAYERQFNLVILSAGALYYLLERYDDSIEFYLSASLDIPFPPSMTIYREVNHTPMWYIEISIDHSFDLPHRACLNLGFQAGYLVSRDAAAYPEYKKESGSLVTTGHKYQGPHDGLFSLTVDLPIGGDWTLTPELYYSFPLNQKAQSIMEAFSVDGDQSHFLYGGVTLGVKF